MASKSARIRRREKVLREKGLLWRGQYLDDESGYINRNAARAVTKTDLDNLSAWVRRKQAGYENKPFEDEALLERMLNLIELVRPVAESLQNPGTPYTPPTKDSLKEEDADLTRFRDILREGRD